MRGFSLVELSIVLVKKAMSFSGLTRESAKHGKEILASSARMTTSGFSLVELSIVLVILGLLTGGILTGQNLIRAAELRRITAEKETIDSAVMTFRDKYLALPGDMSNAKDFWGEAHSDALTCKTTIGTGTQTCNGNSDGQVGYYPGYTYYPSSQYYELFRFWQHMANAGMVEGSFTGTPNPAFVPGSHNGAEIGVNVPESVGGVGISLFNFYNAAQLDPSGYYSLPYLHGYFVGKYNSIHNGPTNWPAFSGPEAYSIDTKLDDGLPATGTVHVLKDDNNWWKCTTTEVPSTAKYEVSDETTRCSLIFAAGF